MKNLIIIFSLAGILFSVNTTAQQNLKTKIGPVKQKAKTVEYTVISPTPFYVGDNVYVLHIGNKSFHLNEQINDEKNRGYIKFFIPMEDFAKLNEDNSVYLTYGYLDKEQEQELAELSKIDPGRCWPLGKFSKKPSPKK